MVTTKRKMSASKDLAKLCRVCQQVNFAAILTPREWDTEAEISKTIYRPEWTGTGKPPDLRWTHFGKTKRTGPPEDRLPQIRTAFYEDRSASSWESFDDLGEDPEPAAFAEELSESGDDDEGNDVAFSRDSEGPESGVPAIGRVGDQTESKEKSRETRTTSPIAQVFETIRGNADSDDGNHSQDRSDSSMGFSEEDSRPENDAYAGEDELRLHKNCLLKEDADWFEDEKDFVDDDDNSDSSASTWSNYSHFTEIQRIDLEKQARGDWSYCHGQLYYLGTIWDLRSRRHECDLCARLWRQTRTNPDIQTKFLTKSRCIFKLMKLHGKRNDGSNSEVIMLNLVYIYGYKLGDPRDRHWNLNMSFAVQGTHRDVCELRDKTPSDQVIPFRDDLFGQARWREDECNYELFRKWLRVCEVRHDHDSASELATDAMTIRLVNVHRKCLVEWNGPASEAPRFMALSYVWGKSRQEVMLTTSELNNFKRPGFFDHPLDKTIRDAIELVSKMGEKYLWVDALCILQDSGEDKSIQIPQMDKVYGKAILTIVAAQGADANVGLSGVGQNSRIGNRFMLELENIRLSFRGHTKIYAIDRDVQFTENYLRPSAYLSRSWTFQEGHLSTRLLIFTKDQVYFECPRCTWCEETHWESDTVDFLGWRSINNPTPQDVWQDRVERRANDLLSATQLAQKEPARDSYAAVVKEYTGRNLSYDEDILDACTGVLNTIGKKEQTDFAFALRTKHFGNDLLFNTMQVVSPRFPGRRHVESGFPSWSWLSWKAVIEIVNEPRNNTHDIVENLVPCHGVKCFMLRVDRVGKKYLQNINKDGGWRFQADYERRGEGIFDPTSFPPLTHESNKADDKTPSSWNRHPQTLSDEIHSHSQSLGLPSIQSHPSFASLIPNHHILFKTFSATVFLRTELNERELLLSRIPTAGTVTMRPEGVWEQSRGLIKRNLYACQKRTPTKGDINDHKTATKMSPPQHHHQHTTVPSDPSSANRPDHEPPSKDPLNPSIQDIEETLNISVGPYIGYIPVPSIYQGAFHECDTTMQALMHGAPDGIYTLLWMNNNVVPMMGGIL